MRFSAAAVLAASSVLDSAWAAQQTLLRPVDGAVPAAPAEAARRKLHGRFLHISDIHPDPHYEAGTDVDEARCHRGHGPAGKFGAEKTQCDSPFSLVDETFRWIKENLADEIDFVIWTGDSARHDGDEKIPRTSTEIYDLNTQVATKMVDVFGKHTGEDDPVADMSVPVIPSMGNNDIFPHNIMEPGPSKVTKRFLEIWKPFIPADQYHTFQRGAYFWTQVVPGKARGGKGIAEGGLAVFSLNTMYFFQSNSAVDGCDAPSEPGYEQMEWLRIQLQVMRERKMKAILIGHVPPAWTSAKESWDQSCWKKYVLWSRQYRDVIAGSAYGHMNLDHFILHDGKELKPPVTRRRKQPPRRAPSGWASRVAGYLFPSEEKACDQMEVAEFDPEEDPELSMASAENYLDSLRDSFWHIFRTSEDSADDGDKKHRHPKGGKHSDHKDMLKRIGGKYAERYILSVVSPSVIPNYYPTLRVVEYNISSVVDGDGFVDAAGEAKPRDERDDMELEKAKDKKDKKNKKPTPIIPLPPDPTAVPGPAYSNQAYTWLGYKQYYANITVFNGEAANAEKKKAQAEARPAAGELRKRGKGHGDAGRIEFQLEYDTRAKPYKLSDMTVRSYIKLARLIVDATAPPLNPDDGSDDNDDSLDLEDPSFWDGDEGEEHGEEDEEEEEEEAADDDEEEEEEEEEEEADEVDEVEGDDMELWKNWRKRCRKPEWKHTKKCQERRKRKQKQKKRDRVWHAFVKRAFVGTVSGHELDQFGVERESRAERERACLAA